MIRKLLLISCCALVPSASVAQEWTSTPVDGLRFPLKCHKEAPAKCVVYLEAGDKAPVTGVLQTPLQAAEVAVRADADRQEKRCQADIDLQVRMLRADKDLENGKLEIDNKTLQAELDATNKALEAVAPEWYERPSFTIPASIFGTLGVVGLSAWIACSLRGCD